MAHLVWDWNGTLLNDTALVVAAANAMLVRLGGRQVSVEEYRSGFFRPVPDYYAHVLGRPVPPDEFARLDATFHDICRAGLAGTGLAPDACGAMAAWGGTQSLLSMFFHDDLMAQVRLRGLQPPLGRVDGLRQHVGGGSKTPYLVAHLAAQGVPAGEAVLVGDTVDDAAAARAVGAAIVLYTGGITDAERLAATGAPLANSLREAVAIAADLVAAPAARR
ncbi:MAG: HAD hydrolase-like protein [Micrococcales bacterium]|nr:HAD hydrolase-like protein [Micrococcales bacterium]